MAKKGGSEFVCQNCGSVYPKWQGKCDACGEWNTIVEEKVGGEGFSNLTPKKKGRILEFVPLSGAETALSRIPTGIKELDRVSGGGLVPGSAVCLRCCKAEAQGALKSCRKARRADREARYARRSDFFRHQGGKPLRRDCRQNRPYACKESLSALLCVEGKARGAYNKRI